MGKSILGVVVTRVRGSKSEMPVSNISEMLELPILGVVPEDQRVQTTLVMKEALVHSFPKCKASQEYKRIAAHLIGEEYHPRISLIDRMLGKY